METTANIAPSSSADRFALRRADSTAMTEISPEMTEMVSGGKTTVYKFYRNGNIKSITVHE
ncbi:MAG: hypothetical protein KF909_10625 [Rhodocyclaceae bacterium]|nr:hypothetical protein [Rhodocyclaceae bacterium]MCP5239323.1 hypothetical protein [Zoogloeaceae bacterium]MCB1912913.1 hypothetical protein [Rhodocyclaceae bacterium]MCP5254908.1 hypothetical protein [Zoogloeaceae bacterium]MCP5295617.1 hypothetical protein [Zoogloeaceae bacterium]